jgi:transcriptional regulator NrdR family protein
MNCEKCGENTRVINTRTPNSPAKGLPPATAAEVHRIIGWYTPAWVMRIRVCTGCRARAMTIEIYAEDLEGVRKEKGDG